MYKIYLQMKDIKFTNSKILHCPVGIAKKDTLHTFSVIPKRSIVHLHGLEKYRKL